MTIDKELQRKRKAIITLMEADTRACKTMVIRAETYKNDEFRLHIVQFLAWGNDLLKTVDPQMDLGGDHAPVS